MRKIKHFHLPARFADRRAKKRLLKASAFLFLSFFLFLQFVTKEANAVECQRSLLSVGDKADSAPRMGVVGREVKIQSTFYGDDEILASFIFYGEGGWQAIAFSDAGYGYKIESTRQYSSGRDYTVAIKWVYRDLVDGQERTEICSLCLRVFDVRETTSGLPIQRLTYPSVISGTQVIKGSRKYIGLASGGSWTGNNLTYATPADPSKWWLWNETVTGSSAFAGPGPGAWNASLVSPNPFYSAPIGVFFPKNLPTQFTFNLTAAVFNPGEGSGAYSDYNFNNLLIYSRDLQKNPDGTCGGLPPISSPTPTPTSTPTPTLTPLPISNKCATVSGYVRNSARVEKLGISGAKVRVWAMRDSSCTGSYSWCGTGDLTTNAQGYFSINCSAPMSCLRVIEVQNTLGYKDSTVWPSVPTGSTVWSVNQVVWKNPPAGSCGTFVFYDVPLR